MRTHTTRKPTTSEAGFTMLEALAAIAILCFGLLAVASMQSAAIQGNYTGRLQTEGTTWAQDRMERLLALSYADLDETLGPDPIPIPDSFSFPDAPDEYDIKYLVKPGPDGVKRIEVQVEWTDKGFTRTNVLKTYKPNL
jgi:type II secretory pathway pseudopilin PulG